MIRNKLTLTFVLVIALSLLIAYIIKIGENETEFISREGRIPLDAVKITPENDIYPLQLNSNEYEELIPLPYPINTAGAEDSPFISEDGNTLYFFFTPDVRVPVEKQILDGVTGVYASKKVGGAWQKPERIILQDKDKLAMDGCEFVKDDIMWFCSVREGYTGIHWFTAEFNDGRWQDWKNADFNPEYKVGEIHIADNELYFHSDRDGGKGGLDLWVSENVDDVWSDPRNVLAVNSEENEGWPFVTKDRSELWFTRQHGSPEIWRSKWINEEWQEPEKIISFFAGEPSLDKEGNIYFVHHYYKDDKMIEADIYVAYKR